MKTIRIVPFLLAVLLIMGIRTATNAQKYALVDMEYILKNIPDYEMMNEQLEAVSKKWGEEVEALRKEAETMYKKYQTDLVFLSAEQKTTREEAIVKKEQEAAELQTKYFRPRESFLNAEVPHEADTRRSVERNQRNRHTKQLSASIR